VSGGMVALPCDIGAAGRGQRKVEGGKKKEKGNNQPEVWQREWWRGGTAVQHRRGRQGVAPSGSGGKKKRKGNNQLEVWQREWWRGGTAMPYCLGRQPAAQSGSGGKKKKNGNNQPQSWRSNTDKLQSGKTTKNDGNTSIEHQSACVIFF